MPPLRPPQNANRLALIRLAVFVGLATVLAMGSGDENRPLVAANLLWLGSMISALAAAIRREPPTGSPTLTRWDEAAGLMLAALLLGMVAPAK